ncbi:hypothetical protein ANCCEY_06182 [Ancylostoma ceylanicum]|uniref:Uncharacterized protein n=1 Tax=Ancylostoma ceylanicum TaxID=53326 RepID=A0A0D6M4B5_9BILA|nr:hypothetical protein ANCCEY_06182 [Ancylostoma ceylanicum]
MSPSDDMSQKILRYIYSTGHFGIDTSQSNVELREVCRRRKPKVFVAWHEGGEPPEYLERWFSC